MSRARRTARQAPPSAPTPRAARFRDARVAVIAGAIVLAGIAAFVSMRIRSGGPPVADEAAGMSPEAAYVRALQLRDAELWRESLAYFRRSLAGTPGASWEAHANYGGALHAITMRYVVRAGRTAVISRSSAERVELGREAIAQIERAAELAPDGATRAMILADLANVQLIWGFRWETYRTLRAAAEANPSDPELGRRAATFLRAMRDPTSLRLVHGDVDKGLAPH